MVTISRRKLLVGAAVAGGGLLLAFRLSDKQPIPNTRAGSFQPNAWLQITQQGEVIFQLTKSEMGQGVFSSLPVIIAEELDYDPSKILVEMAGVHPAFNDPQHLVQLTGGSNSVATSWMPLREAGACARAMLIASAATQWGIQSTDCRTDNGKVINQLNGHQLNYGQLVDQAALIKNPRYQLKAISQFSWVGKPMARLDTISKCNGTAQYGMDINLPGMKIAVVVRSPSFAGSVNNWQLPSVLDAEGVVTAFAIHSGIAIVAHTYWQARKAANALIVEWHKGPLADLDSSYIRQQQQRALREDDGHLHAQRGDINAAWLETNKTIIKAHYASPFAHHSTMEPQNAAALVTKTHCELWAPSQCPDISRALAAHFSGIKHDNITVHTPFLGGGFGRRGYPDFVGEVAAIACRMPGVAIKLMWSREDDMQHDYYRPASYHGLQASLDNNAQLCAWQHKVVSPSIVQGLGVNMASTLLPTWVPTSIARSLGRFSANQLASMDPLSVEGANIPYQATHLSVESILYDPGVPTGFWRSVAHSHNCFAAESFMDEIAHAARADPLYFRRKHLPRSSRLRAVLDLVAQQSQWGSDREGVSQGVAISAPFDSFCAMVVEVSVDKNRYTVLRVVTAVDCGLVINPAIVHAQVKSAIIFALTAATKAAVTIKNGGVEQSNFHDLPILRINETPIMEVHVVPSAEPPTGIGEIGVPAVAPALANALFKATGQRLREMPLILG